MPAHVQQCAGLVRMGQLGHGALLCLKYFPVDATPGGAGLLCKHACAKCSASWYSMLPIPSHLAACCRTCFDLGSSAVCHI